jgi:hypothetical protein
VEDPLAELMVGQDTVPSGLVSFDLVDEKLIPTLSDSGNMASGQEPQLVGVPE